MQVIDRLAAVRSAVDHGAVAARQFEFLGELRGDDEQVADEFGIVRFEVGEGDDLPFGNHQQVRGRLRIDVAEGDAAVVLVDDVGGDLAIDDSLEDGFVGHG